MMELTNTRKTPYDIITYFDIKNMERGQACVYAVGTQEEVHNPINKQQMRVIRTAIEDGIATSVQKIRRRIVKKLEIGVDIENVYEYTVVRL